MRQGLALLTLIALTAGCANPSPTAPKDDFAGDTTPGQTFPLAPTDGLLAEHLTVEKTGRVSYRVLAHEGAHVDTCIIPGWDAQLWWANHTTPTQACTRDKIIATASATLTPGPWTLVVRAYGCPDGGNCTVSMWTKGATLVGTALGPVDNETVDGAVLRACAVC